MSKSRVLSQWEEVHMDDSQHVNLKEKMKGICLRA